MAIERSNKTHLILRDTGRFRGSWLHAPAIECARACVRERKEGHGEDSAVSVSVITYTHAPEHEITGSVSVYISTYSLEKRQILWIQTGKHVHIRRNPGRRRRAAATHAVRCTNQVSEEG